MKKIRSANNNYKFILEMDFIKLINCCDLVNSVLSINLNCKRIAIVRFYTLLHELHEMILLDNNFSTIKHFAKDFFYLWFYFTLRLINYLVESIIPGSCSLIRLKIKLL